MKTTSEHKHFVAIDGLRALSIFLVICFHCNLFPLFPIVDGGLLNRIFGTFDIGVDCFFVISGFLITGILMRTKKTKHYYKNFFFRRMLRIFPLYYMVLIVAFCIVPLFDHPFVEKWAGTEEIWYWFYLSNIEIANRGRMLNGLVDLSWSLSIEEQFYLVWPWIVLFTKSSKLKWVCLAGVGISILSRILLYYNGGTPHQIHFYTFCRLDSIMMGSFLAVLYRDNPDILKRYFRKIGLISLAIFSTLFWFIGEGVYVYSSHFSYLLSALFFTALLVEVIDSNTWSYKLFSKKSLIFIGKYSYGIYLFHSPIQKVIRQLVFKDVDLEQFGYFAVFGMTAIHILVTLGISLFLAYFSYHIFEKQFLKLKKYFTHKEELPISN